MAQNFSQRAANTVEKLWLVKEMVLHGETAKDLSNLYGIGRKALRSEEHTSELQSPTQIFLPLLVGPPACSPRALCMVFIHRIELHQEHNIVIHGNLKLCSEQLSQFRSRQQTVRRQHE